MAPGTTDKSGSGVNWEKLFLFLASCLKHTANDGKTDWDAFIAEHNIVNVSAAKRRFKRMMDPYGIAERNLSAFTGQRGAPKKGKTVDEDVEKDESESPKKKKGSPVKKRKVADTELVGEDGEGTTAVAVGEEDVGN